MADILHRIGIKSSSIDAIYQALTTREGLAGWWTTDTKGEGNQVGGILEFRFGAGGFDMKVTGLSPSAGVLWEVIDGPEEWLGTRISWELRQEGDYAIAVLHKLFASGDVFFR